MTHKVEIYGRDDCRFCAAAVAHCERNHYPYVYHDVGRDPLIMQELVERLGEQPETVPQIFIAEHHVGGFTEFRDADAVVRKLLGAQ